ncbi:MAG: hypothetical protein JWP09_442 [Candidatus Taylorbacteria bacterium]|nr:hypothetical protein [Candidatus Taylorbacteria bacterium]
MVGHVRFLGYTTEAVEPKNPNEKQIFVARHPQKNNIVFFELFPSFTMFRVNLTTERKFSPQMDSFINKANKAFSLSKMYYEIEADTAILRIEAVYTGEYVKECFGAFLEMFISEQNLIYQLEGFSDIFLGKD